MGQDASSATFCWAFALSAASDAPFLSCWLVWQVFPHGSTDALPYATMGSGSLNAMAVFESSYEDDMEKSAAVDLVTRAIRSGIYNDLGSGALRFTFTFGLWAWEAVQSAQGSC